MDQFVDAAAAAEAAAPKKKTKKKLIQKTYQDEKGDPVTANVRLSRRFLSLSLSLSPRPPPPARAPVPKLVRGAKLGYDRRLVIHRCGGSDGR